MKVAILGTVPESRQLAPFTDSEWSIWCCSPGNAHGVVPKVDVWFELHSVVDCKGQENKAWAPQYFEWLKRQAFPVYMQEPNDLVPQATVFPVKMLLKEFFPFSRIAFTSSISMMMAYALHLGAEEIGIYGVDMAADTEAYTNQKAGCQVMMALAHQRGVKIQVPLESCLATPPPLYGYAEASRMGRRLVLRENSCITAVRDLDATIARLSGERSYYQGALEDVRYMRRTFVDGEDDAELDEPAKADEVKKPHTMVTPSFGPFVMDKASGVLVPKPNEGFRDFKPTDGA